MAPALLRTLALSLLLPAAVWAQQPVRPMSSGLSKMALAAVAPTT